MITIDLGVNYLSSYNIQAHDGISIDGVFSYSIIGDDGWSIELFKSFFIKSIYLNIFILLLYSGLRVIEE